MSKRFAAASGMFLAAAAIAGAAVAYADEPAGTGNSTTPPGASLTGAVSHDLGAPNPEAADELSPAAADAAPPAAAPAAADAAAPADTGTAAPADDGAAAPPNPFASMASSMGTSMASTLPIMSLYVPVMLAPSLLSGGTAAAVPDAAGVVSSIAGSAAAVDPAATAVADLGAGSAAAVDPDVASVLNGPADVDLSSILDPSMAVDVGQDGLEHGGNATSLALGALGF
ncbi:MAG: hypothetical protein ABI307_15395 [Mycobacterium sp.]